MTSDDREKDLNDDMVAQLHRIIAENPTSCLLVAGFTDMGDGTYEADINTKLSVGIAYVEMMAIARDLLQEAHKDLTTGVSHDEASLRCIDACLDLISPSAHKLN